MNKITLKGKLRFDPANVTKKHNNQASWKRSAMVLLNDNTAEYYAWFIKKRFNLKLNQPLRGTHFTVISDRMDKVMWDEAKKIFNNKEIEFTFNPELIRTNAEHWWLAHVESQDAMNIRTAMGLGDPYFGFHITIGYVPKDNFVRYEHSKYIRRQILRFGL